MKLQLYILRTVAIQIFAAALILMSILQILDLLDVTSDILDRGLGVAGVAYYAALRLPRLFEQVAPISVLAGGLFAFSGLARESAIVAMRASGISGYRIVGMAVPAAVAVMLLDVLCAQVLAPRADPALADWCESHLSFPETMVDRIVPQPTEEDRSEFKHATGVQDEALLITEHFRQWVIEDNFMTDRPPWEAAGVQIVQNVAQFEMVKLRMLNAAHSALAYFGLISGYDYIHEAMADEALASFADYLLRHEVMPMIDAPPSMDLKAYQQSVLERFRNPAIAYRTAQVATDGSMKLPQRIFPSLQAASEKGGRTAGLSLAAAAWLRCMTDTSIAAKFSDPASGLTDPGALLAATGANREIAQIIASGFEQISQGDCRSEIQAAIAGQ